VDQASTAVSRDLFGQDPVIATWWASSVECASALNRLHREKRIEFTTLAQLSSDLDSFASSWVLIPPVERVKRDALRILRIHPVRAADALQLAAALTAAGGEPESLEFVTRDSRLATAAQMEGFQVI
jgi:hypothetical protein